MESRKLFDEIFQRKEKLSQMSDDLLNEDDQFEKNNEIFGGNLDPDIVGLNNLFAGTGIQQDDEFLYISDGVNNNSGEISNKKSMRQQIFLKSI